MNVPTSTAAAGADQPGEQREQLALVGPDLHVRHRAEGRGLVVEVGEHWIVRPRAVGHGVVDELAGHGQRPDVSHRRRRYAVDGAAAAGGQSVTVNERVTVAMDGGVADVRLNRPDKLNALDTDMFVALVDAGARLASEPSVRAVVLSGEGRSFSAGLDFSGFQAMAEAAGPAPTTSPQGATAPASGPSVPPTGASPTWPSRRRIAGPRCPCR